MPNKNDPFESFVNKLRGAVSHVNTLKMRFISFRNSVIISLIVLIGYLFIVLLSTDKNSMACFRDISGPLIELIVGFCLFYAAKLSGVHGRRVQNFWLIIGIALLCYGIGDVIWAIMELVLHQQLFPSFASIFYFLFYFLFVLGILYLPGEPLSKNKKIKMILDTSVIFITAGLIFGIFFLPYINSSYGLNKVSIAYAVADLVLFLALLRILFNNFKGFYRTPLLLLGMGIFSQIITDNIYSFQVIQGIAVSGGFLNAGWLLAILFIYLAAAFEIDLLMGNKKCMEFELWIHKFNFPPYLPLLTVLITYVLVILVNNNKISISGLYIEAAVGIIILLAVFRQGIILNENENLYLAAKKEIESRKKSEEALKLANIYNRSLIEVNLDPLVTIGLDGKITDVNSSTETVTGYSRHELIGTDFSSYFTEHDKAQEGYKKTFQNGSVRNYPLEIQNKNGKSVPVLYNATTYKNESGEIIGVFAAARDINELKKAEDKLKASLNEKELLLKEIHHRVKNNMQIISSLLSLQSKYIEDNSTIQILKESEVRIKAMSLVHEAIYLSDNLSSIPFQSYIQRLVMDIIIHYNTQWITPKFNIEDINFNIETAIPCGLIITEIVTNSIKYAFLNNEGVISVEFTREMDKLKLTVSDNGRGLPEHLLHEKSNSLGLLLVEMLVNQLEGELKIDNRNGTTFTIIFKELEYAERV
ncbi:sensor histidine kinase [Methanobacterium sp. MBAC-LM]|uniref:sensor histidine kinase n=1 Tax=Methanobacterium sp. MBAC-LM TaxID=3412034 RepID=UPI003C725CAC